MLLQSSNDKSRNPSTSLHGNHLLRAEQNRTKKDHLGQGKYSTHQFKDHCVKVNLFVLMTYKKVPKNTPIYL